MQRPELTRRDILLGILVLVLVPALVKSGLRLVRHRPKPDAEPTSLAVHGTVPDFELTDRSGRTIRNADLMGKVWVVSFICTTCGGTCPVTTMRMKELHETLKEVEGLCLVSFSVDPDRDTAEALDRYAARHGADHPNWFFLRGDQEAVDALLRDGFRPAFAEVPPGEQRPADEAILHSDRLALVDAQGRIRGMYRGGGPESEEQAHRLAADIRELVQALSSGD